jgi:hypothetical protein
LSPPAEDIRFRSSNNSIANPPFGRNFRRPLTGRSATRKLSISPATLNCSEIGLFVRHVFLAGRDFDERDTVSAPKVRSSTRFSQRIFGRENPVGRSFRVQGQAGKPNPIYQVVGLMRNTKYNELREDFKPIGPWRRMTLRRLRHVCSPHQRSSRGDSPRR